MKNDRVILASAQAGFDGKSEDGMWSSPCWLAHAAGQALERKGMARPVKASMSRGYAVRLETVASEFIVRFIGAELTSTQIVRIDR